jgi:SprT-like family
MSWLGKEPPCVCQAPGGTCINADCSVIGCCQIFGDSLPMFDDTTDARKAQQAKWVKEKRAKAKEQVKDLPSVANTPKPLPEPVIEVETLPVTLEAAAKIINLTGSNSVERREGWLHNLMDRMECLFAPDYHVPSNIRVSCGFPSRKALISPKGDHALGQCWYDESSADKHFEIFISPILGGDDPMTIAATLAHEMCHTVAGREAKHGPKFKAVATRIGLEGKMTATQPSDAFRERVQPMLDDLGPYPMAKLDARKMTTGVKKQSTRLLKAECPDCGYTVRIARKWLDVGLPDCPECRVMLAADVNPIEE